MATYRGIEIDLTPTAAMAAQAKQAVAWRKEGHRGGTQVGATRAGQLIRREELSPETVRRMFSFFSRHQVDKKAEGFSSGEKGYPSPGRVAWGLWGGDTGFSWARSKVEAMNRIDAEAASKADQPRVPSGRRAGRWMLSIRTENGHRRAVASSQRVLGELLESAGSDMAISAVEAQKDDAGDEHRSSTWVRIRKFDRQTNIIYGVVYAPGELDNQGEVMFADAIEQMAHRFMELDLSNAIDTFHDGIPNGCRPVESFIARKGDPDYPEGAWVMGVRVTDDIAHKVEKGEVNGFSFDAIVKSTDVDVVYAVVRDRVGRTEAHGEHQHLYFVQFDEVGRVVKGQTDEVNGHSHSIRRASVTEATDDHSHRFYL